VTAELLDLLPDAVLQVDAAGTIVRANAAASRLTGYPPARLVGQPCQAVLELRGREGEPVATDGWRRATRLRSVRGLPEQDLTIRTAAGADARVLVTGSYQRDDAGRLTAAVLVLRDAGRRGRQPPTGIEIISTLSHELRSPLTSVKGYTSLLLHRWDQLIDEEKQMMLEQIHHDADRITRLITELLDIGRLETGRLVLRRQMIDLAKLVATVVDKVRLEYPDLEAAQDFDAGFPKVYADPDKVEQVLTNLVENACKYASPTGLSIIGGWTDGDVSVTVADRGEGIPADDLPKVFTKFFRRSEARPTGSGLGLWISRGLVEAHGGRLVAEPVASIGGRGTAFRFTLPHIDLEDLHRP
jgi:PAS domain S-box-containing protein